MVAAQALRAMTPGAMNPSTLQHLQQLLHEKAALNLEEVHKIAGGQVKYELESDSQMSAYTEKVLASVSSTIKREQEEIKYQERARQPPSPSRSPAPHSPTPTELDLPRGLYERRASSLPSSAHKPTVQTRAPTTPDLNARLQSLPRFIAPATTSFTSAPTFPTPSYPMPGFSAPSYPAPGMPAPGYPPVSYPPAPSVFPGYPAPASAPSAFQAPGLRSIRTPLVKKTQLSMDVQVKYGAVTKINGLDATSKIPDPPKLIDRDSATFLRWVDVFQNWAAAHNLSQFLCYSVSEIMNHLVTVPLQEHPGNLVPSCLRLLCHIEQKICAAVMQAIHNHIPSYSSWVARYTIRASDGTEAQDASLLATAISQEFDIQTVGTGIAIAEQLNSMTLSDDEDPREFFRKRDLLNQQYFLLHGTKPLDDFREAQELYSKLPPSYHGLKDTIFSMSSIGQGNFFNMSYLRQAIIAYYQSNIERSRLAYAHDSKRSDRPYSIAQSSSSRLSRSSSSRDNSRDKRSHTRTGPHKANDQRRFNDKLYRASKKYTAPSAPSTSRAASIEKKFAHLFHFGDEQSGSEQDELDYGSDRSASPPDESDVEQSGSDDEGDPYVGGSSESDAGEDVAEEAFFCDTINWIQNPDVRAQEMIYDTGANHHIITSPSLAIPGTIREAHIKLDVLGRALTVRQVCTVQLTDDIAIKNVCIVPNAGVNIVSGVNIALAGYEAYIYGKECIIRKPPSNKVLLRFIYHNGVFSLIRKTHRVKEFYKQSSAKQQRTFQHVDTPLNHEEKSANGERKVQEEKEPASSSQPPWRPIPRLSRQQSAASAPRSQPSSSSLSLAPPAPLSNNQHASSSSPAPSTSSSQYRTPKVTRSSRVYHADGNAYAFTTRNLSPVTIHQLMGHQTLSESVYAHLPFPKKSTPPSSFECDICATTKQKRQRISRNHSKHLVGEAKQIAQVIHADLIGPITNVVSHSKHNCVSYDNKLYSLTVVDEFSRYVAAVPIRNKSDTVSELQRILLLLETQSGNRVQRVHTDGGTEFVNETFRGFCHRNGIRHTTSTPYTPEHNGLAERYNGLLITAVRAMIKTCGAPLKMWSFAIKHAALILNLTPLPQHDYNSPSMLLYPQLTQHLFNKLSVFGSDCYIYIQPHVRSKFDATAKPSIYIGIDPVKTSVLVMDPLTHRVESTNNVQLRPGQFTGCRILSGLTVHPTSWLAPPAPAAPQSPSDETTDEDEEKYFEVDRIMDERHGKYLVKWTGYTDPTWVAKELIDKDAPLVAREWAVSQIQSDTDTQSSPSPSPEPDELLPARVVPTSPLPPASPASSASLPDLEPESPPLELSSELPAALPSSVLPPAAQPQQPRRSTRVRHAPTPIYVPSTSRRSGRRGAVLHVRNTTRKSTKRHHSLPPRGPSDRATLIADNSRLVPPPLPNTFKQAMASPYAQEWYEACVEELAGIDSMNIYTVVPRPRDTSVTSMRWVFTVKTDNDGNVTKFKARLVARGFSQVFGENFFETFSTVIRPTSIKMILQFKCIFNLQLEQMDIKQAFLHADLKETVYTEQPPGFEVPGQLVWKLNKALYGLKQSPREWYNTIASVLKSLGYRSILSDTCVFVKPQPGRFPIVAGIYVDDLIITYDPSCTRVWQADKSAISAKLQVKEMGFPTQLLNIKIDRINDNILQLSQAKHILNLARMFDLVESKRMSTPGSVSDLSVPSIFDDDTPLSSGNHRLFRQGVGSLLYINVTRPDISYATAQLTWYLSAPKQYHLAHLKNVVRYLVHTKDFGIVLGDKVEDYDHLAVAVYTDATWASDRLSRRSVTGMVVMLCGSPISWCTKKQPVVSSSSAEAEYLAMGVGAQEALWYRNWIKEVYVMNVIPNIITDNQSARTMSENATDHGRTKHIDTRFQLLRERISWNEITSSWVSGQEQIADGFTKALPPKMFLVFREHVVSPPLSQPSRPTSSHSAI